MQNYCTIRESQNNLYWKACLKVTQCNSVLSWGSLDPADWSRRWQEEPWPHWNSSKALGYFCSAEPCTKTSLSQDFSIGGEVQLVTLERENNLWFLVMASCMSPTQAFVLQSRGCQAAHTLRQPTRKQPLQLVQRHNTSARGTLSFTHWNLKSSFHS